MAETSKEVQERAAIAAATETTPAVKASVPSAAQEQVAASIEETILKILEERAPKKRVLADPNWATLSETTALNLEAPIHIPLIEHDVPVYMDVKLADPEYVAVWVNKNQIRIGAKQAEGYEFVKKDHFAPGFPIPLKFTSEGFYEYADVICMRVHKRILFGRRRAELERSINQLKDDKARERAKSKLENDIIQNDPSLDLAFRKGSMSFY